MTTAPFRILLVEDNPHMLEMLSYGLQRSSTKFMPDPNRPVEVRTAADGQQAHNLLLAEPFGLLITDLYMPILDGKQLIKKARAMYSRDELAILAISASSVTARDDALECGADIFLRKPVTMNELIETVKELLTP